MRVKYSEFERARQIISYLDYYWEFFGKENKKIVRKFGSLKKSFNEQQLEEYYKSIKRAKVTNTVKLTRRELDYLQTLVTLTNTLERMSEKKRR